MSKKLLTELRSFAESTSVRGIPREIKAKTQVTCVVWLVAVLTCAALLVWQLSVVLTRYFQYPVSTLTVQAPAWQHPTFPDITICNNNPAMYVDLNICSSDTPNDIFDSLNKSFSYTMNDSPIILVEYVAWFNSIINGSVQMSATWDPYYYKCFTLRPLNSERGIIRSLSAILYVDQVNDGPWNTNSFYDGGDVTGLNLMVHAPGTAPDMSVSVNIVPATETIIELTQSARTRLGQPYSNCTDKTYLPWDNTSAVYTLSYCVNTCVQQKFVDKCECVTARGPQYTIAQLREVNFQVCEYIIYCPSANVSQAISQCYKNGYLPTNLYQQASTECSAQCVLPCSEFQYDAAMNVAPWPGAAYLNQYSNYVLSDPRFLHLFNISKNANDEEISSATTTPAATEFFKSRFLALIVQFDSPSFIELKDVAAFSVDAMGAQVGGVLSLWLGVTVMFAFEAFEFLYTYLTNYYCKKEPTQASSASVTPSVENPRRSAVRRSHHSLRRSSNRALSGKLSASKRQIRCKEKPKQTRSASVAPTVKTKPSGSVVAPTGGS